MRTWRQDHIPGLELLPNEYFGSFKTKIGEEADCLTTAVEKKFGGAGHVHFRAGILAFTSSNQWETTTMDGCNVRLLGA